MRTATSSRSARLATISTIGAMIFGASVLAATPAAASDTQDAYYEHHWMCVELFFSDTEAHADSCLPSRIAPSIGSSTLTNSRGDRYYYKPCQPTQASALTEIKIISECDVD